MKKRLFVKTHTKFSRLWLLLTALCIVAPLPWTRVVRADSPRESLTSEAEVNTAVAHAIDNLAKANRSAPFQTTRIYDRNGDLLYEVADRGRRTIVSLDQIPDALIQATIATEDRNFYQNTGIDLGAIARAALQNLGAGRIVSGGSTISQQLARILWLPEEERYEQTIQRKIREAYLAMDLNGKYTKDEILEMYLNTVYYGQQAYGVAEAARTYFNKPLSQLTLAESALIAGLPQAPNNLDPFENPDAARDRQGVVLQLMRRQGFINGTQVETALAEDLQLASPERGVLRMPHFVDYVRDLLTERYGPEGMRQGLQVYTSIDPRYQALAEEIARAHVTEIGPRRNVSNAAIVILNPPSGQILAMVGSLDYHDEVIDGQVNVTVRPRQPGSAIKPVLYATAFNNGWTPASIIWDTPVRYPLAGNRWYEPRNITSRFYGPLRLRAALANSLNVSAVKLLDAVGVEPMLDTARKMGINSWRGPTPNYGLSLTVGGYEVTLLELTHAYATLANNGAHVPLAGVTEIRDAAGRVLFHAEPPDPPEYAVSPVAAYQVTSVLSDARTRQMLFGQTSPLDTSRPTAVKTGTTQDWRDSLTVGYTPDVAVGVWLGNSDGTPMRDAAGFQTAGPVWHDVMEAIWADESLHDSLGYAGQPMPQDFERPEVSTIAICDMLPANFNRNCPVGYEEIFAPSDLPADVPAPAPANTTRLSESAWGYCLPALQAKIPNELQREATFVPLPDDEQDAAAARRWAANYGLELSHPNECNLTPVSRQLAEQPTRPEPKRLIKIPEPQPSAEGGEGSSAGPLRIDGQAMLVDTVRGLNIRSGPGIDNPVVDYLLPSHVVSIREGPRQVGPSPWFEIRVQDTGVIGWVNGRYLQSLSPPAEDAEAEPATESAVVPDPDLVLEAGVRAQLRAGIRGLNIRSGPGAENDVVEHVRLGDVVAIQEGPELVSGDGWYLVVNEANGAEGWVNGNYLVGLRSP